MGMRFYPDRVGERFWSKVDKSGECWEWKGYRTPKGYGTFSPSPGRRCLAHRFSSEMVDGPIPDDVIVMHTCDNPSCVRPDHLVRGTAADKIHDMWSKGRQSAPPIVSGTRHHSNILTEDQVHEIRFRRRMGENGKKLAKEFGVSHSMIYDIATAKKWKHLPERTS